jgi:hypothetical protein
VRERDVVIGGHYVAKVNGRLVTVRVLSRGIPPHGWYIRNLRSGRTVHIRSARRLRYPVSPSPHTAT